MTLMSYDDALDMVIRSAQVLDTERVCLSQALGRVLAEDVPSDTDKPLFDNSAMDGYCVRSEDVAHAGEENPVRLKVVGEISAGSSEGYRLEKGTAVKIFTGAPIPEGGDCVVPVEFAELEGDYIVIKTPFKRWANVRKKGEEIKEGETVLKEGTLIRGYELGILAFVNRAVVKVYRRPTVGILATGDEILDVGEPMTNPAQIRTSNNYTLYGLALNSGALAFNLGIVKDDPEEIRRALSSMRDYDIFITTGGVSMGEKDFVQYLVKEMGVDVKFHKLKIKPAKPVLFGTYGEGRLFFGLPGNPVSCAIAFDLLVKPAMKKMMGLKDFMPKLFKAILKKDFKRRDAERREFVRALVEFSDKAYCDYSEKLQSHMLTSYSGMNAYMVVYEGVSEIKAGQEVDVMLL